MIIIKKKIKEIKRNLKTFGEKYIIRIITKKLKRRTIMKNIDEKDFEKLKLGDLNYYLIQNMKESLSDEESEIRDNILFIPAYSLSIRPETEKAENNIAVINYHL